ncbi:MAG TPA: acyl-ACP--UDP-N-acetylglucosamine O-acyltransferase [bacterium]|nr:acyl-ACP--UDP-N-acetylglucosamine O-acyltransferase [bacterium]HOL35823.1 acyl-ACP--UDP-N-acetylglucosamine O-acyltransferase [bacterium]HPP07634.1 acyl-ACP--UDP-N-acetylglucosamine O-acyltransferase [bacterium]
MPVIHPSAVVSSDAEIGEHTFIGPYAVIEGKAKIGSGCFISPMVHIGSNVEIGNNCKIYTSAAIGNPPQDLKYRGERSFVKIGNNNTIREFVTINTATGENQFTIVGDNNLLMAYVHVAHNCVIGNNCIIANAATIAGHVFIDDYAIIGGLVGIHQFSRIGKHAIIGGCSKITKDIIPFITADGHPARPHGINTIGLKRRNFSIEVISILEDAYKIIFRSNLTIQQVIEKLKSEFASVPEIEEIIRFLISSERGIARERE